MFAQGKKAAGNQGNHQNFDPSLPPKKLFMGMKQKKEITKISWIGPWISSID